MGPISTLIKNKYTVPPLEKYVLLSKDLQKSSLNVNNLKGLRDFVKRLKLLETRM